MRTLRLVAASMALLALVTACSDSSQSESSSQQPALAGSSWVLSEVLIGDTMTAAVDASASINFDADGRLYGSTGCNRFSGTWTLDGDVLTLDPGASTMMACAPAVQAQETSVLAALAATKGYLVADDQLTLTDADDKKLAIYRGAVTDLANTSWTATGVNNGKGAVVTTSTTSQLTLVFGDDGSVTGFGGCTDFSGTYIAEAAGVSFEGLQPTASCTDNAVASTQEEFLAALAATTNFSIDGTRLDLRDESGALQVGLTAAS